MNERLRKYYRDTIKSHAEGLRNALLTAICVNLGDDCPPASLDFTVGNKHFIGINPHFNDRFFVSSDTEVEFEFEIIDGLKLKDKTTLAKMTISELNGLYKFLDKD